LYGFYQTEFTKEDEGQTMTPRRPWNQARPETREGEFYEDRRIQRT